MSVYYGNFVLVNSSADSLDSVSLIHECGPWRDELARPYLSAYEATGAHPMKSETGHNDHWKLSFHRNGIHYHREKQCNYDKSDEPQAVTINVYKDDFSIIMPVSSDCEHVGYNKG
jgi:hypothetical protein